MEDLLYGYFIASTRCFNLVIGGKETITFVPISDMLNHHKEHQVTWNYDNEKKGYVLKAIKDIKMGEQVYNNYGFVRGNLQMYLQYGFLPDNIDEDRGFIELPLIKYDDDECYEAKLTLF